MSNVDVGFVGAEAERRWAFYFMPDVYDTINKQCVQIYSILSNGNGKLLLNVARNGKHRLVDGDVLGTNYTAVV